MVFADVFPELSETFVVNEVLALRRLGLRVRVEASSRPPNPARPAEAIDMAYLDEDPVGRKLADLLWLFARHPLRCARDLAARPRRRREEPVRTLRSLAPAARRLARGGEEHLHAHFAAGAGMNALRLAALLDLPFSVTAHAYEVFQRPQNLVEKLERADFVTSGCDYNVRHLRGLLGGAAAGKVHRIVMGVDPERFRRRRPHPGGRMVMAVGRLVEKKGFIHLIEATGLMAERPERVVIVGDGPLRQRLAQRAAELGVDAIVELVGAREPREVRELLEQADVLVMPSVIAADGDRDSMPVVVKEALAMEVPVVASDEVGLPEVVRPEWGALVPPGDGVALAGALERLLALPGQQRAEMGRRGRDWVMEHCSVERETEKLARLVDEARRARTSSS